MTNGQIAGSEYEVIRAMYEYRNMDETCANLLGRGFRVRFADHHQVTLDIALGINEVWIELLPMNHNIVRVRAGCDITARDQLEALWNWLLTQYFKPAILTGGIECPKPHSGVKSED